MIDLQYQKLKQTLSKKDINALDKVVEEICKVFSDNPEVPSIKLIIEDHRSEQGDAAEEIVINNPWHSDGEVME